MWVAYAWLIQGRRKKKWNEEKMNTKALFLGREWADLPERSKFPEWPRWAPLWCFVEDLSWSAISYSSAGGKSQFTMFVEQIALTHNASIKPGRSRNMACSSPHWLQPWPQFLVDRRLSNWHRTYLAFNVLIPTVGSNQASALISNSNAVMLLQFGYFH